MIGCVVFSFVICPFYAIIQTTTEMKDCRAELHYHFND